MPNPYSGAMRVARPVAVTVLGLLAAACGGGAPIAHASPSGSSAATVTRSGTTTTSAHTAAVSTSPAPTPTPRPTTAATPTAPVASAVAATPAARTAAPTPVPGPCGTADVALSTTTDLPSYTPGQTVQVSVAAPTQSAPDCLFGPDGVGDMLAAGDLEAVVEDEPVDVDTARLALALGREPVGLHQAAELLLLALVDRLLGQPEADPAPGLDLEDDEGLAILGDDV